MFIPSSAGAVTSKNSASSCTTTKTPSATTKPSFWKKHLPTKGSPVFLCAIEPSLFRINFQRPVQLYPVATLKLMVRRIFDHFPEHPHINPIRVNLGKYLCDT